MKSRAFLLRRRREFAPALRTYFTREIRIFTHKFTPLSILFAHKFGAFPPPSPLCVDVMYGSPPRSHEQHEEGRKGKRCLTGNHEGRKCGAKGLLTGRIIYESRKVP